MSTGIALHFAFPYKRMSGLRPGLPEPLPQASQVRRNLFGPIDHEENLKFVQDELSKISQADCKKWNFDFTSEKPNEGRYNWEPVREQVPQAYEMRALVSANSQQQQSSEYQQGSENSRRLQRPDVLAIADDMGLFTSADDTPSGSQQTTLQTNSPPPPPQPCLQLPQPTTTATKPITPSTTPTTTTTLPGNQSTTAKCPGNQSTTAKSPANSTTVAVKSTPLAPHPTTATTTLTTAPITAATTTTTTTTASVPEPTEFTAERLTATATTTTTATTARKRSISGCEGGGSCSKVPKLASSGSRVRKAGSTQLQLQQQPISAFMKIRRKTGGGGEEEKKRKTSRGEEGDEHPPTLIKRPCHAPP